MSGQPDFESEDEQTLVWGCPWGIDTEYAPLRAALLPAADDGLAKLLADENCTPLAIPFPDGCLPGDLLRAVSGGVVLARPADLRLRSQLRPIMQTLAQAGCPILRTVSGAGLLVGGDAIRLSPKLWAIGCGQGTNQSGAEQLEQVVTSAGQTVVRLELPGGVDRLEQALAPVDSDLVLVDRRFLPRSFIERLMAEGLRLLELSPEDTPAIHDCLVLRPGRVLLPEAAASRLADRLDRNGIDIVPIGSASVLADLRRHIVPLRRG